MSTTKLKLTNPTDDELSAAVAEHVAGYKNVIYATHPPRLVADDPERPGERMRIGLYATSADAVLPLLEKCRHWKAQQWEPNVVWVDLDAPNYGDGVAETFPRAACVALLRANGIEVE